MDAMLHIGFNFLQLLPLNPASCCRCQFASATADIISGDSGNRPANAPSTQPAKQTDSVVVQGTIRAQGQALPSDMVVYLEPADPKLRLPVSDKRVQISQKAAQFSPAFTV